MDSALVSLTGLVVFPVLMLGIWCLVCAILAKISGYRSLLSFRVDVLDPDELNHISTPRLAWIGSVAYRGGILTLHSSLRGLTLQVSRLFPFHPPVRIPWHRVRVERDRGNASASRGDAVWLDDRVRLTVPEETLDAIRLRGTNAT